MLVDRLEKERRGLEERLGREIDLEEERLRNVIRGIRNVLHRFGYLHRGYPTPKADMLAEAGLGVTALPAYAWSFARGRDVVSRPLTDPQVTRSIYLIQPDGRSLSPAAEGFARTLRKQTRSAIAKVVTR